MSRRAVMGGEFSKSNDEKRFLDSLLLCCDVCNVFGSLIVLYGYDVLWFYVTGGPVYSMYGYAPAHKGPSINRKIDSPTGHLERPYRTDLAPNKVK
jgi:hypothetical protein